MLYFFLTFLPFILIVGQEIPQYDDPYSPIFTDKNVYSWTEKVKIMIVAPSWNSDKNAINSLGDSQHPVSISTRDFQLKPYKLVETDVNSGIFVGEVILTGFEHDANGDGIIDTNPRTQGRGPTDGFIQTDSDSAITISFEFAEGVVLTHSAQIKWNIGQVMFMDTLYDDKIGVVRIIDRDMNLNPESVDNIPVSITSDSDPAGIRVMASEVNENSGLFEAQFSFSQNGFSSGSRLYAIPGDSIYAEYRDFTLPAPYSKSDNMEIITQDRLESHILPTKKIEIMDMFLVDALGNPLDSYTVNDSIQIQNTIANLQSFRQNFVQIFQVIDQNNKVVLISWIQGTLEPLQNLQVSQSWTPKYEGVYKIESFVWKSLTEPVVLSEPQIKIVEITV